MKNKIEKINKRIYLDNAATTPIDKKVLKKMEECYLNTYGNPSGLHAEALAARKVVEVARKNVCDILNCHADELIFTGGGTEGDNLAILGVIKAAKMEFKKEKIHIVTTEFEHSAVVETCRALENEGVEVTYVKPKANGVIDPKDIKEAIKNNTVLVSVMYANNEIGTIQPISEIAKVIRLHKKNNNPESHFPYFHTDAIQALNYLHIDVGRISIDLMTLSGSKIYGPKGIGVVYVKRGVKIEPIIYGGTQEKALKPGTENVSLIAGFAEALGLVHLTREKESARLIVLRDYFIDKISEEISGVELNGDRTERLPNNINVSIDGIDNELLVIQLDSVGVACSTRSACKVSDEKGSHVIISLGKEEKKAKESIRFSLGRNTTKSDINYAIKNLIKFVKQQRDYKM